MPRERRKQNANDGARLHRKADQAAGGGGEYIRAVADFREPLSVRSSKAYRIRAGGRRLDDRLRSHYEQAGRIMKSTRFKVAMSFAVTSVCFAWVGVIAILVHIL